ncbi:group III truncated hemoglobin [Pseudochelatococcus sp. G4_1912]|uniref:group III truncated hemoglobin n=1 Tax=Pseudochelatococcus sp. G4_1912 TaxID=3114288 RepID=UPI0039C6CBE5
MEEDAGRRAQIIAEITAQTGIDDKMISDLVDVFYGRVREDAVLGPIFNAHVSDWDNHLSQMRLFWSSVALMSGRYHGRPMPKHMNLPIDSRHFDLWLKLFMQVAQDVCPPKAAEHFIERARRIAESLEYGVAAKNGAILKRDERFINPQLSTEVALEDTSPPPRKVAGGRA